MLLTRLVDSSIVVLSKVIFEHFCTEPETLPNQFDQIDVRLSQIVLVEVREVLLGTQARHAGRWVAADDGE